MLATGTMLLLLAACTTGRVATEMSDLATLVTQTRTKILPKLKPGLESDRQAEITAAAINGDVWQLSPGCKTLISGDFTVSATPCYVEKIVVGDRVPEIGNATAVQRKLDVLGVYIAALELLAKSTAEDDLVTAYSAAITSLTSLGVASENAALIDFLNDRADEKDKTNAVVSVAIAALRYQKMKSVVLRSNASVKRLTREIQASLIALGVDAEFLTKHKELSDAEELALTADRTNPTAYRAALVRLETTHKSFVDYFESTTIYEVGLIGRVHATLHDAMKSPGSVEEVISYLGTLRDLYEKVKE